MDAQEHLAKIKLAWEAWNSINVHSWHNPGCGYLNNDSPQLTDCSCDLFAVQQQKALAFQLLKDLIEL